MSFFNFINFIFVTLNTFIKFFNNNLFIVSFKSKKPFFYFLKKTTGMISYFLYVYLFYFIFWIFIFFSSILLISTYFSGFLFLNFNIYYILYNIYSISIFIILFLLFIHLYYSLKHILLDYVYNINNNLSYLFFFIIIYNILFNFINIYNYAVNKFFYFLLNIDFSFYYVYIIIFPLYFIQLLLFFFIKKKTLNITFNYFFLFNLVIFISLCNINIIYLFLYKIVEIYNYYIGDISNEIFYLKDIYLSIFHIFYSILKYIYLFCSNIYISKIFIFFIANILVFLNFIINYIYISLLYIFDLNYFLFFLNISLKNFSPFIDDILSFYDFFYKIIYLFYHETAIIWNSIASFIYCFYKLFLDLYFYYLWKNIDLGFKLLDNQVFLNNSSSNNAIIFNYQKNIFFFDNALTLNDKLVYIISYYSFLFKCLINTIFNNFEYCLNMFLYLFVVIYQTILNILFFTFKVSIFLIKIAYMYFNYIYLFVLNLFYNYLENWEDILTNIFVIFFFLINKIYLKLSFINFINHIYFIFLFFFIIYLFSFFINNKNLSFFYFTNLSNILKKNIIKFNTYLKN